LAQEKCARLLDVIVSRHSAQCSYINSLHC
jgi:hypothetical protein